jgi:hypothetical protein
MKKIDINSIIIWNPEWISFKERWIKSILDQLSPRVRSDWKKTIRDFYAQDIQGMKDLFDDLIQNNWIISVPNTLKDALEKWLPILYTDTLGKETSWLRGSFFWLFSAIDINICPYCNHIELNDVQYEIDHIKDKSTNPLYSLNIHNLIPICHDCNQGKSTYSWFCNFYEDEIYNSMTFKVSTNINNLNTLELDFSLETVWSEARIHKDTLLKPLYLNRWRGIYNKLTWYVKYQKFRKFYEWVVIYPEWYIWNWSEHCLISECSLIHKHKHSKFILDIINDSNYDVLRDL